jgi:hypothetical protein
MIPKRGSGGKRLAGKLHEPFERADGGRALQPHLLRLYSEEGAVMALERRGDIVQLDCEVNLHGEEPGG